MESKSTIHEKDAAVSLETESSTTSNPSQASSSSNPITSNPSSSYVDNAPSHLDEKQINWVGIALIVVGALFFFNNINIGSIIWKLSPLALVALGVYRMRQSDDPEEEKGARTLILIGALIFVFTSGLLKAVGALLPIALVAGGIYMLNRQRFDDIEWRELDWVQRLTQGARGLWQRITTRERQPNYYAASTGEPVHGAEPTERRKAATSWVFFGSSRKKVMNVDEVTQSRSFFGEMELDLRPLEGQIEQGDVYIDTQTVFAETRVFVPASWRVNINNSPVMGEVSDRTNGNINGSVTLHIGGSTVFGETRITN